MIKFSNMKTRLKLMNKNNWNMTQNSMKQETI